MSCHLLEWDVQATTVFAESPLRRLGEDEVQKLLQSIPRDTLGSFCLNLRCLNMRGFTVCRLVALTCSCWAAFMKARFEMAPGQTKLIAAAIFDCDGVLLDCERAGSEAVAEVLTEHGWNVKALTVVDCYLGWSISQLAKAAAEEGHQLPGHMTGCLSQRRETKCQNSATVEGVAEALKELKDGGVLLCATSIWGRDQMVEGLKRHGLETYFDHIASSVAAPEMYLECARAVGVSPKQCIAVDDSAAGIKGAVAAGCSAIGFMGASHLGNGWVDSFMLMNAGALTAAPTMKDVTSLVLSQTKPLSWK